MSSTERRYRLLLRMLPAWYRERYEDEMVEVYLAGRSGDDDRPGAGEVAATARLALVARTRAVGRPGAATLWLLGITAAASMATSVLTSVALTAQARFTPPGWTMGPDGRLSSARSSWPTSQLIDLYGLLWLVVLGLLLLGLRRGALVVASVAALLDISRGLGPLLSRDSIFLEVALAHTDARATVVPLLAVGAILLAGRAPGDVPRPRSRIAAVGSTAALLAVGWLLCRLGWPVAWAARTFSWPIAVLGIAVASVVVLVAHRRLSPAWPAAVLTLAALAVVSGFLPAGPTPAGVSGDFYSYELVAPGVLPGLVIGVAALLVACVAWVITSDRHPPRPRARQVARELGALRAREH
jgi:hypothetical protein